MARFYDASRRAASETASLQLVFPGIPLGYLRVMLLNLIRDGRTDLDAASVARDALLQRGYSDERIDRALESYVPITIRAATQVIVDAIVKRARTVNGRMTQRRIELFQIGEAMRYALERGVAWRHGGYPTASSYGYSWSAGACSAVTHRDTETVRVRIARVGNRTCPWGLNGHAGRIAHGTDSWERLHTTIENTSDSSYDVACSPEVAARVAAQLLAKPIGAKQ